MTVFDRPPEIKAPPARMAPDTSSKAWKRKRIEYTFLWMLLLTLIYSLVLESTALPDLLTGFVLSGLLIYLFRAHLFSDLAIDVIESFSLAALLRRILFLPVFVLAVALDIVKGSLQVAKVVLHLTPLPRSGFIYIPMGERSHLGVLVSALAHSLSPGSIPVQFDWEKRLMLFHILDASDPDGVRDQFENFYQRFQKPIFP